MATLDERLSAAKRVGGKPSALREAISAEEAAASEMFSADSAAAALARARAARLAAHAVADEELKSVARSNSLERAQAARAAARAALAADAGPDDARESLGSSFTAGRPSPGAASAPKLKPADAKRLARNPTSSPGRASDPYALPAPSRTGLKPRAL